jgi:predicted secreted protein
MRPCEGPGAMARRAASLALAGALLATPALAGDRALIDFIGFSAEGRYFAFEEFGVQDGSGFPYSNIYVIDVPADKWVAGTPYRVRLDDAAASLAQARDRAAEMAGPRLEALGISDPADLVALNGDGEMGDGTHLNFGAPGYFPNDPQGVFTLRMEILAAESPEDCESYLGDKAKGFALTLTDAQGERDLFRDDVLPRSRGCPTTYRIYGVVAPQYATPPAGYVAIIATYPFGFEGPDRRFIAVPLDK